MKKFASYIIFTILLACIVCACNDDITVQQSYEYQVECLPVPKRLKQGETIEIRCEIICSGEFEHEEYFLRYFQPDGDGELRFENSEPFLPNDLYKVHNKVFRLYYTSLSTDQQTIDIYFIDSFNKRFTLSFQFNDEKEEE